jgi:hypothetical protein
MEVIRIGTVKVVSVGEIIGRTIWVLKEEVKPYSKLFKITMQAELYVPISEINYLLFFYLIQKKV